MSTYTVVDPTTAEAVTEVEMADLAATDAAIERAHEAFASWRAVSPGERARLLRAFATVVDPVASLLVPGVRTVGSAGGGRREWYGATSVSAVTAIGGTWRESELGSLAPVDPPCRFGFSSTPRRPSVTSVVTTIERPTSS